MSEPTITITDPQTQTQIPTNTDPNATLPSLPKSWPLHTRLPISSVITSIGFLAGFASASTVPAIPSILAQFHLDPTHNHVLGAWTTSIYVLGFGLGPFILAPLSELYGRKPIYLFSLLAFILFHIGCALAPSLTSLIILRFLSGCSGSVAPGLGPASMSDLWDAKERGVWNSFLSIGVLCGPPVGSVVASFVLSVKPWPWIFWIITAIAGFIFIVTLLVFKETYEPVIRRRAYLQSPLVKHIEKNISTSGHTSPMSAQTQSITPTTVPLPTPQASQLFFRALSRPLRFLFTSPIVLILSIFQAYSFAMLYLILVSLPLLFTPFSSPSPYASQTPPTPTRSSFPYLSLIVGFVLAGSFQMTAQTIIYRTLSRKYGEGKPEYRIVPMFISVLFFPVGLLCYGWSVRAKEPLILPEVGLAVFSFGVFVNFQSIQIYLAEAFIPYNASAIAAATLMRCVAGAVFPLFGQGLFMKIGYGWASTILALLAVPAIPIPWILYRVGGRLRGRFVFRG